MKIAKIMQYAGVLLAGWAALAAPAAVQAGTAGANRIEQVEFSALPGDKVNLRIRLSEPLASPPAGFTMANPARIALDFPATENGLDKSTLNVDQGVLRSLNLVQGKGRTRLVLNLKEKAAYETTLSGSTVNIALQPSDGAAAGGDSVTRFAEAKAGQRHRVDNVDFMRGKNGEGRVVVDLSDNATGIDIRQQGQKVVVDFIDAELPERLQRRLNVTDFATPVLIVDTVKSGKNVRMTIEPKGVWEHSAYQANNQFIVEVRPVVEDPSKLASASKGYTGEKLSLNFQDIEVRAVLQVIADFTGFNIITSDNVSGRLTLRLKDVPWDQALDLIMKTRGLGMRKEGNVMWIAPNEELAAKEKARLDAEQEIAEREPLYTEIFALNYHKAEDFKKILTDSKERILSKRGSVVIDPRSNTLFVQDTAKHLEELRNIVKVVDVPVRQVLVEGRIVIAEDGFSRELGTRFAVGVSRNPASHTTAAEADYLVNLPAVSATSALGVSIINATNGWFLDLELSAAEAENRTKTISSPKVITANRQKAIIDKGVEIPYQEASSSGATAVSFKKATLGLEVTPQITPDNKISMDLIVKKDSVGERFEGVPSINTNRVQTQVLVGNGETVVLGGVFEDEKVNEVDKVPFLGDLPVLGNLFKRTLRSTAKKELLIFITPRLMDDNMVAN